MHTYVYNMHYIVLLCLNISVLTVVSRVAMNVMTTECPLYVATA